MQKIIYGIQQVGVGVSDAVSDFHWYARMLGADVKVFDDSNTATYMARYMGGEPQRKRAILAANLQGGSCYEIWQFADRIPQPPKQEISIGDTGIFAVKIKAKNIEAAHKDLKSKACTVSEILQTPNNQRFFYLDDPQGNKLQIVSSQDWFKNDKKYVFGGISGCIIGVSDVEHSLKLYSDVLGYDKVLYDQTSVFEDFAYLNGGNRKIRRLLLTHSEKRNGRMAALLGRSYIELVQLIDDKPQKIYDGRFWGDLGFIHLCFDIFGMERLKNECIAAGFPFTVESDAAFKMGDAAGHWAYLEDPDGTLIEFVETKKIPLLKKWNLYLKLEKRDPHKSLPRWLISAMAINRVKV